APEYDLALVRLAGVDGGAEMQNDDVEARLDRFADHRLQRVGMNRQLHSGFRHDFGRVASARDAARLATNFAYRRPAPDAGAVLHDEAGRLAILNDVDAEPV